MVVRTSVGPVCANDYSPFFETAVSVIANACAAITHNDPHTRGIVVLGLEAPTEELAASFAVAAANASSSRARSSSLSPSS